MATAMSMLWLWLQACYGYVRKRITCIGVLRVQLRAYYSYNYERTTATTMSVLLPVATTEAGIYSVRMARH